MVLITCQLTPRTFVEFFICVGVVKSFNFFPGLNSLGRDDLTIVAKIMKNKFFLIGLTVFVFLFSFTVGRYEISIQQLFLILVAKVFPVPHLWPETIEVVVYNVRLPRILAAMLVGAALATSGAAYQGMFKNPLVSPDILGAAAGAGFGAAIAIYFSLNIYLIQLTSFIFGLFAVLLTYFISQKIRMIQPSF